MLRLVADAHFVHHLAISRVGTDNAARDLVLLLVADRSAQQDGIAVYLHPQFGLLQDRFDRTLLFSL